MKTQMTLVVLALAACAGELTLMAADTARVKAAFAVNRTAAPAAPALSATAGVKVDQAIQSASATTCPRCSCCLPEEIAYHDVITHRCRLVPDKKQIKKTIYDCKEVPFCLHKLPPFFSHHGRDCCDTCCQPCAECDCPRYKKVLLKKEIVCEEICGTKCVVEEVVERVPCRVCRPCPKCSQCAPPCTQPTPGGELAPIVDRADVPSGKEDNAPPLPFPAPPIPTPEP